MADHRDDTAHAGPQRARDFIEQLLTGRIDPRACFAETDGARLENALDVILAMQRRYTPAFTFARPGNSANAGNIGNPGRDPGAGRVVEPLAARQDRMAGKPAVPILERDLHALATGLLTRGHGLLLQSGDEGRSVQVGRREGQDQAQAGTGSDNGGSAWIHAPSLDLSYAAVSLP